MFMLTIGLAGLAISLALLTIRLAKLTGQTNLDRNLKRFHEASDFVVKETRPWE
jgi:hypothetical protein